MKTIAFFGLVAGLSASHGVTPVQKVIEMMKSMYAKGEAEMDAEQKTWHEYAKWCKDTSKEKEFAIRTATSDIERLQAAIQKHSAKASELGDEIAEVEADIATWSGDLASATALRKKEHEDYVVQEKDYAESVDALARAIAVLSSKSGSTPQAAMLLQTLSKLKHVPAGTQQQLVALLEMEQAPSGAPAAAAYEFQSSGVVDMLEKLHEKFSEEYSTLVKDEKQAQHNFDMMALELSNSIAAGKKESAEKSTLKSDHEQQQAEAEGDLAETQAAKAADEKYLQDLVTQCDLKHESFEQRQALRKEELEAVQKAIEIIESQAVSGAADKHLPGLMQKSFAFLQASTPQQRVVQLLASRAAALESHALSFLALRAQSDPMEKVRQMIRDLIKRLEQEAAEEAEHKAWCDKELHDNKLTREEKTQQVDELTAQAEQLTAAIAAVKQEIADLNAEMVEMDKALAEATELRSKEKAKNTKTIAEAQAAIEAVKAAMKVLKEFYAKASTATALVQQSPADDAPASWDEPYQGQQGSSKGVVGMLEVIETDFTRLEHDTTADEDAAAREYKAFAEETKVDREAKRVETVVKGRLVTKKERELAACEKDLKATQAELDAALAYYDELKPACLEAGVSFEERAKQREAEIQSLNEAWNILNDA